LATEDQRRPDGIKENVPELLWAGLEGGLKLRMGMRIFQNEDEVCWADDEGRKQLTGSGRRSTSRGKGRRDTI
jgi:hypothetical protein